MLEKPDPWRLSTIAHPNHLDRIFVSPNETCHIILPITKGDHIFRSNMFGGDSDSTIDEFEASIILENYGGDQIALTNHRVERIGITNEGSEKDSQLFH